MSIIVPSAMEHELHEGPDARCAGGDCGKARDVTESQHMDFVKTRLMCRQVQRALLGQNNLVQRCEHGTSVVAVAVGTGGCRRLCLTGGRIVEEAGRLLMLLRVGEVVVMGCADQTRSSESVRYWEPCWDRGRTEPLVKAAGGRFL